ncbi:MAG TPA: alpha/beta hydrolase, partial [Verrucomicrobiae bacterium]|nr:alpha/beta hydrolase [Verrucomicrobiae bacterium]
MKPLVFAVLASALSIAGCAPQSSSPMLSPTDITLTPDERAAVAAGQAPEPDFIARLQGPREIVDGQTLNAKVQFLLEQSRPNNTPENFAQEQAAFATPEGRAEARAETDRRWRIHTLITQDMARTEDLRIPSRDGGEIPARLYVPQTTSNTPLPVLVYYHGGGFIFASVDAVDRLVRLIANEAQVIVVSVDYRLAPEHPYPAAHNDAEDAFLWVRANASQLGGDSARVGAGGDSAGGHLASVTALRQVAASRPTPTQLLLYYPAVTMARDDRSYELFGNGYGLDLPFIETVTNMTFPDVAMRATAEVSPLNAPSVAGMPPAIVVTAGFDPLRNQGRRFAERLQTEGGGAVYH